jgi:hypothetical protein
MKDRSPYEWVEYAHKLEEENKRMREALEKIDETCKNNRHYHVLRMVYSVTQAALHKGEK